ncbi:MULTISPECIES: GcrA family cell cycle regulator [Afifella]|uniref:GcrA family cell cycle regulator n=1 Tax=Afifella TaxID=643217 RepID=UPI000FE3625B|nr:MULTISPECIES: GcrA family cell cycle regulator [Afifella]MCF1504796.1 GcrA cell cycle regulator [Afifella sp. H1R]MCT8269034.1 GcrA cell cycle regulator [Afifella sp. JA880]
MSWTDERVDLLKKLWQEGLSASQIAGELGGVTRNAVIGKIHRLGLSGRGQPTSTIKRARRPRNSAPVRQQHRTVTVGATALQAEVEVEMEVEQETELQPVHALVMPISRRLTIEKLTERTCKWPIGDPGDEDFHFCGCDSLESSPYCEYHAGVAYQTSDPRRRMKRAANG